MVLINKYNFGSNVFPNKIFKFNIKNRFEKVYKILKFDNFNYNIITYLFFLSLFIGFLIYVLFFNIIYPFVSNYYTMLIWRLFINIFFIFLISCIIYLTFIFFLFFKYEFTYKKKEKNIEDSLTDFLDDLVSNLKGGIPIEKALLKSVRKDQDDLLKEMILINEKIILGDDVITALRWFKNRFESPIIHRTFFLIEEGLIGGGNIASAIETISKNLENINNLSKEYVANSEGFVIVIMVISIILSPILFSIAIVLLNFLSNLFALFSKSSAESNFLSLKPIPSEFILYLKTFSYFILITINFFSSLIIAQLKNEKIYNTIKYIPFFILVSLMVYSIVSKLLLSFFSSII